MAGQFINAPSPSRREARNFENELDIVIVGNKSDKNVTSGQYVTVRDSSITGITDGIYKATANVAAGTAFVAANLDAVTSGALNDLNGNLAIETGTLTRNTEYVSGGTGTYIKIGGLLFITITDMKLSAKVSMMGGSLVRLWTLPYQVCDTLSYFIRLNVQEATHYGIASGDIVSPYWSEIPATNSNGWCFIAVCKIKTT